MSRIKSPSIVTYTMGNLFAVKVHAANIHGTKSRILPAREAFARHPAISRFSADVGCRKTFEQEALAELGTGVDISRRINPGFQAMLKRRVVERTFARLGHSRRPSKNDEISSPWRAYHTLTPCSGAVHKLNTASKGFAIGNEWYSIPLGSKTRAWGIKRSYKDGKVLS